MSKSYGMNDPAVTDYVYDTCAPEDPILEAVRKRSVSGNLPRIAVGPMDGRHLEVLTRLCSAKNAVEIGTLGGYSAICIARGLAPGGKLYTCELSPAAATVARANFAFAGVSHLVEVLEGPALETLPKLTGRGPFDLVFIDADKPAYPDYCAWATENLKVGGVVIGDNTFAWGLVAAREIEDANDAASAAGMRAFNHKLAFDKRFRATIFPTGEGLTVAVKVSDGREAP